MTMRSVDDRRLMDIGAQSTPTEDPGSPWLEARRAEFRERFAAICEGERPIRFNERLDQATRTIGVNFLARALETPGAGFVPRQLGLSSNAVAPYLELLLDICEG